MKRTRLMIACALVATTALVGVEDAGAFGRDADGSRMQARSAELGSSYTDTLSPPGDSVDWRYVRISSAAVVTATVRCDPSSSSARITMTDSVGKTIARSSTRDGTGSIKKRLDPGLYYISVSSDANLRYTFSLR